jgi:hypothetical protein
VLLKRVSVPRPELILSTTERGILFRSSPAMRLCLILQLSVFFQLFVGCKASPSGFTWGHYSAKPKQASAVDSKEPLIHNTKGLKKKKGGARRFRDIINEFITGNVRKPSSRSLQHLLYWITSLDAIHSVFLNEYSSLLLYFSSPIPPERTSLVPSVYSKLFYFARLRPRLLYSIGALIRALQLCTPFRRVLDPTVVCVAGLFQGGKGL